MNVTDEQTDRHQPTVNTLHRIASRRKKLFHIVEFVTVVQAGRANTRPTMTTGGRTVWP